MWCINPDETVFGSINLRNVLKIRILAAPYKKKVYYRTLEGVIHYRELHTKSKSPGKTEVPEVWNHVFLRIHSCESGFESKPNQLTVGCMLWTRALAVLHGCACLWLTIKPNKSVSSVQNPRVKGEAREMLASLVGDWAFPTHTFYRNKLWVSS